MICSRYRSSEFAAATIVSRIQLRVCSDNIRLYVDLGPTLLTQGVPRDYHSAPATTSSVGRGETTVGLSLARRTMTGRWGHAEKRILEMSFGVRMFRLDERMR